MPGKRKTGNMNTADGLDFQVIAVANSDSEDQDAETTSLQQDAQQESDDDELYTPQGAPSQKKRYRPSKKTIPDFRWDREANQQLGEFVRDHEELYDKRSREWLNVEVKNRLFIQAGQQLDPPATGAQCKKQYENMRTRVGKILRKESRPGVSPSSRTQRDNDLLEAWGFLQPHIGRSSSNITEEFSHSPHPCETEQPEPYVHQVILSPTERAGPGPSESGFLSVHSQLIKDFSALMETHMRRIPEASWHQFQIDSLNLVAKYTSPPQPSHQTYVMNPPRQPSYTATTTPPFQQWQSQDQGQVHTLKRERDNNREAN